MKHSDTTVMMP